MANKKITDLPELAETPNDLDLFEIVDVSTGTSKKIKAQYLGGGGSQNLQEVTDIGSETTNAVGSTSAFYVGAFFDWLSGNTTAQFMAMYADLGMVIKDYGPKAPMIFKNKLNDNTITLLAQNKPEADYLIADTEDIAALQTQITEGFERLSWKNSARIAIDTPLAMSGSVPLTPTLTIQGVTLIDDDRVILIAQSNPIYNGVYRVNDVLVSGNYRLYRTNDANTSIELTNIFVPIAEGTYLGKTFRQTVVMPIINTNSIVFEIFGNTPTNTSDLINDGEDGINPYITLLDLPSNLILYPTTVASDVVGYVKLVTDIHDPEYNVTAVDVSTGSITTTNQLISSLITVPDLISGNPGVFNISTVGNIRKTTGTGTAEFYFNVYKRDSLGTETLIGVSNPTLPVNNGVYAEFSATAIWDDGVFTSTDRIVLKFYGSRIAGGSNPTYQFQFGGTTPVRTLVPIPLSVVPSIPNATETLAGIAEIATTAEVATGTDDTRIVTPLKLKAVTNLKQNQILIAKKTTNSTALTGTTAEGILESILIPANTYAVGDIMKILNAMNKTGTAGNSLLRTRINTINSLTGSVIISTGGNAAATVLSGANPERHFNIRSGNLIEGFPFTVGGVFENGNATVQRTSTTFDPTQDTYILLTAQLGNASDSVVNAQYLLEKY